jgi:hypothetical protein
VSNAAILAQQFRCTTGFIHRAPKPPAPLFAPVEAPLVPIEHQIVSTAATGRLYAWIERAAEATEALPYLDDVFLELAVSEKMGVQALQKLRAVGLIAYWRGRLSNGHRAWGVRLPGGTVLRSPGAETVTVC